MSLEQKISELKRLQKIQYPSDQEIEEMSKLEDEIKVMYEESIEPLVKKDVEQEKKEIPKAKVRGNMLRKILFIKTKEPPKPVTNSELEQLTLQARKEELLTRIATAKAKRKGTGQSVFESIQKVISKSTSNPFDMSASSKKRSDYDPFRW